MLKGASDPSAIIQSCPDLATPATLSRCLAHIQSTHLGKNPVEVRHVEGRPCGTCSHRFHPPPAPPRRGATRPCEASQALALTRLQASVMNPDPKPSCQTSVWTFLTGRFLSSGSKECFQCRLIQQP